MYIVKLLRGICPITSHTGMYDGGAPQMYAKESMWCANITPNRYLHVGACLVTFRHGGRCDHLSNCFDGKVTENTASLVARYTTPVFVP